MTFDVPLIALLAMSFLAAGTVKGVVGLGLPTTAIGLMTLSLPPREAIAFAIIPMVALNAWQVYRAGDIWPALKRYLPFVATLMIGVGCWGFVSSSANATVLYGFMGAAILLFVLVTATRWAPPIANKHDTLAQIGFGSFAGAIGGLTSIWAPPMAMYLTARHVSKDEFVRATGLLIFLGSIPLATVYIWNGVLSGSVALVSTSLLVPGLIGFTVGETLRHRLSEHRFRQILLGVFFILGLNLLRRSLF